MHAGARIQYRVALFGNPACWTTRIPSHQPGRGFADEQESGTFALSHHTHEFREHPRGTWMLDRVACSPR
jgi:ligand-binding SRPBCC domain-containing protein